MTEIARLDVADPSFDTEFAELITRASGLDDEVAQAAEAVVRDVRKRGDQAVLEYTMRFDRRTARSIADLEIGPNQFRAAWEATDARLQDALQTAATRIRDYANHQSIEPFEYQDGFGNRLGQRVTPLDRVGIYVPGGRAAYPSSVLMNAIPARVAGVPEIVMCVPGPGGILSQVVLAAAHLVGVDRAFAIGGAQAVGALAYGTQSIPAVDKIVGPGNAYVAAAKRLVFGHVGIDSVAGPSEVLIVADGGDAQALALDLFAQAEHDERAQAILLSTDGELLDAVARAIDELLPEQPRSAIIRASLAGSGALIRVRDLDQAAELANRIAPEHLELAMDDPRLLLPKIRHAGAIFLGHRAAEAFGDYCAGPNHVLPTSRTARYSNPLGVYEFQKRSTTMECSIAGAEALAPVAELIAKAEGLAAHAASARVRARDVEQRSHGQGNPANP